MLLNPSEPEWEDADQLTVEGCVDAFAHAADLTVGAEEELMLVDPATLDLAPAIEEVLPRLGGDPRFAHELRASQIEIVTRVCGSVAEACGELAAGRRHLVERLEGRWRLLACGTHPFSSRHGDVTEGERYRRIADEYSWAATRSLVCGLHVHVAVAGAERALAVYNALRSYLPELAALGANSAFADGVDTRMASVRPKFNEVFPRSGVPPRFGSWEEVVRFVAWGRSGGLFPDAGHFWWELRPHLLHGTLEVRVADTQTHVEEAAAVVALVQALVAMLCERFDRDERLPVHETHWIAENSWRAHRHGVGGRLVDLATGTRVETRERLSRLLDELEPYGERLGSGRHLQDARVLIAGNGADRQRYVFEREGILALTGWLVDETEAPVAV